MLKIDLFTSLEYYILLFTQKTSNLIKFKQLVTSICLNAYEQNSVEYMY